MGRLRHTLEELEGETWPEPEFDSHLVTTCHGLRKKPLESCTTEDLRIMIGQNIGLSHLLPLACDRVEAQPLAEGDFYPGDLLMNVLGVDPDHLAANPSLTRRILEVARRALGSVPEWEGNPELVEKIARFVDRWGEDGVRADGPNISIRPIT